MERPEQLLSTEMSKFLFRRELGISLTDISPVKYLEVYEDGKHLKSVPFYTQREARLLYERIKTEYVKQYNQPWEDHISIKKKQNPDLITSVKVKTFKVWNFALTIYFDFLLRDEYKRHRMITARIFNRQIQRKGYKGYKTAKDIKKGYQRWLFKHLNPCLNKSGRPTPLIVNWTIIRLRQIDIRYQKIAEILNSLVPWGINCTERKLILRYKRLDTKFYDKEFPLSLPAKDIYLKFFKYYSPPSL